jgi:hypothetical protein
MEAGPVQRDQAGDQQIHERRGTAVMDAKLELMKGHLVFLWQIIGYYKVLFNKAETRELLDKVSIDFFRSFQILCWDRFILSFAGLVDDDRRVESIVGFHNANRSTLDHKKVAKADELLAELCSMAEPFVTARNNFIAHMSKKGGELGAIVFMIADAERIWEKAVECLAMYDTQFEVFLTGGLHDTGPGARALLNHLEDSTLLDKG